MKSYSKQLVTEDREILLKISSELSEAEGKKT
jgi:hypothetical protein